MSLIFEATDAGRLVATKELWEFVEAGPLLGRIDDRFLVPIFLCGDMMNEGFGW